LSSVLRVIHWKESHKNLVIFFVIRIQSFNCDFGRSLIKSEKTSAFIAPTPDKSPYPALLESPATLFGRAIHKALEIYYTGSIEERKLQRYEDIECLAYGHPPKHDGLIERAMLGFISVAEPLGTLPETDKRSLQNGLWILHEYFKTYIDDPYVAYSDDKGAFIERMFTLRVYEDDSLAIDIFGTIDFCFKHTVTGDLLLGDHKTASFLNFGGQSYFDRDKPNHQYTMYALGAREVFGINTENFVVNVVEVKAKPKTKAAKGVSFPRQITKRTDEDFAEMKETLIWNVKNYISFIEQNLWPQGGVDACNKFGSCQYKQVCASPQSLRQTLLENKFTKE
jgi:hypothetical protein